MTEAIISGFLLGLALIFSVGPVIFTIFKLRINYSIKSALFFVAGVWISDLIWILLANFFSNLLKEISSYEKTIALCGGIFLIGIGVYNLFFKKSHYKNETDNGLKISGYTNFGVLITGFLINTLNPAVIGLWLAAATKAISNSLNEKFVLFSVCLLLNMSADVLKINLAGKLKEKLTDKNIAIINKISGLIFIGFGAALIIGIFYNK
jgi:threonine/homoserine/homoserine lactone efflux protein